MILEKIAAHTRRRVDLLKARRPLEAVKEAALRQPPANPFAFEKSLRASDGLAFICEIKKASPSKGLLCGGFEPARIARSYAAAGADAISVLTEPAFFQGDDRHLQEVKAAVRLPVLRKDFTIDPYQIYEAKRIGADAILLICALLSAATLREYIAIADRLGLSCLVEARDAAEAAAAVSAGARVVGVNNRDLRDFSVDIKTSVRLRSAVPAGVVFVSESGVRTPADIDVLRANRTHAVLIGEALMRSPDKKKQLAWLRGRTAVKICGLTRPADIAAVNAARPDYIGFVFAAGKRRIGAAAAARLKDALEPSIQAVGVFVDENPAVIADLCRRGVIDLIQLHGREDDAYIETLRALTPAPIIKAVRVRNAAPPPAAAADYTLFDAYSPDAYGGTGQSFDWDCVASVARPFFLAGGIGGDNLQAALAVRPFCIDVSSGVETDGRKDPAKIQAIIETIRGNA